MCHPVVDRGSVQSLVSREHVGLVFGNDFNLNNFKIGVFSRHRFSHHRFSHHSVVYLNVRRCRFFRLTAASNPGLLTDVILLLDFVLFSAGELL